MLGEGVGAVAVGAELNDDASSSLSALFVETYAHHGGVEKENRAAEQAVRNRGGR